MIPVSKASRGHVLKLGSEKLLLVLTIKGRREELESLCEGKESKRFLGSREGSYVISWVESLERIALQKTIVFEQKEGEILCLGSSALNLKWAGRSELKGEQSPCFDQGCL